MVATLAQLPNLSVSIGGTWDGSLFWGSVVRAHYRHSCSNGRNQAKADYNFVVAKGNEQAVIKKLDKSGRDLLEVKSLATGLLALVGKPLASQTKATVKSLTQALAKVTVEHRHRINLTVYSRLSKAAIRLWQMN
jgi:hypothetical protein